jgi:F-type H+-transporting ATPase subunit gamma
MANLKEVRNRIVSVTSTQQITKAMKMVSAAKLKRATNAIVQLRPYANKLKEILANLSASMEGDSTSPFLDEREPAKVLIVAVSSNRGLAGAFNANVIKTANLLISEKYQDQAQKGNVSIVAIGKKTQDYYEKRKYNVIGNNNDVYSELTFANVSKIAESIMEGFAKGEFDRVELVYNQFKNAAVQILTTEQLLPLPRTEKVASSNSVDYILEPSQEEIVELLIPKSIKTQIFKAVLDSNASEHGARMTAMDKATDNAGDLLKALKLSYNQARQAAITTELTEIVSGAAALSNG